jgi:flagellar hook capping protein FlgD
MSHRGRIVVVLVLCLAFAAVPVAAHAAVEPPPGGPILVVTSSADPFTSYYTEILRAEGLNEFATADVSALSAETLSAYSVVVLGARGLSGGQASLLSNWVQAGGNLIAMRPDATMAGVLGIAPTGGTLSNADLRVDTTQPPGAGITANVMQFHDTADRYALDGARAVATLYQGPTSPTSNPAVTLRDVGSAGGQAAAFTFDLARSIVYTRQGNPAWAGQERDGLSDPNAVPIRSDDLFFGAKAGDLQPDWVDLDRVATPGADEQQRLLANLITEMSADRVPLPRFWYLPDGRKAAVVLTGDDHGSGSEPNTQNGTKGQFNRYLSESAPGCSAADWECIRSTSYVFPGTPISNAEVAAYQAQGFEIALHLWVSGTPDGSANPGDKNCFNFPSAQGLNGDLDLQLEQFRQLYPAAAAPSTSRTHCIVWSDWSTEASAEAAHGVRLDATYYYWPGSWLHDRPGFFTGSGFPMRYASSNGSLIDTYQAATQLTDESDQTIATEAPALFDGALGPQGFYGVFTANMHTDVTDNLDADTLIAAAKARGVAVISARQLLTWMDGRNGSSFQGVAFDSPSGQMTFRLAPGAGARGLQAMVPSAGGTGPLLALTRDGQPVSTQTRTVKGITYAVFDAAAGSYVATYPPGPARPSTGSSTTTTGGSSAEKSAKANPAVVQVLPRSIAAPTFPRLKRSGSSLRPGAGRTFALLFRLPRTASVALSFRNASGKVVRTIRAPRHAKGTVLRLRWDGRDTRGRYVANGRYRFALTATAAHYKKTARGSVRILGSPAPTAKRRAAGSVPALSGPARAAAMSRLAAHLRAAAPTALCSLAY